MEEQKIVTEFPLSNKIQFHQIEISLHLDLVSISQLLTHELQSGDCELYDMINDPNEMRNLWNKPSAMELQNKMLSMLWSRPGIELNDFDDPIGVA